MRDKKFRAWDKELNIFVPAYLDEEGWYTYHRETGPKKNGFVLSQYTGLKDIKGKEIYEGDIISAKIGNNSYEHEVKFRNGHYLAGTNLTANAISSFSMEVVGNIFQS